MDDTAQEAPAPQPTSRWAQLRAGSVEASWSAREAARRGATAIYKCPDLVVIALIAQLLVWLSRAGALLAVVIVLGRGFVDLPSLLTPLQTIGRGLEPIGVRLALPLVVALAWLVSLVARAVSDAVSWGGFAHAATHKRRPLPGQLWDDLRAGLSDALLWGVARDLWVGAQLALGVMGYASLLWMQVNLADASLAARAAGMAVVAFMYAGGLVWGGWTLATVQLVPTVKVQRALGWFEALEQSLGLVSQHIVSLYRMVGYGALTLLPFVAVVWACGLLQMAASEQPALAGALALTSVGAQLLLLFAAQVMLVGLRAASFFWVAALDGVWPTRPLAERTSAASRLLALLRPNASADTKEAAPGIEALLPERADNLLSIQAMLAWVPSPAQPAAPTPDEPPAPDAPVPEPTPTQEPAADEPPDEAISPEPSPDTPAPEQP
jgi:hypothetical protein